MEGNIIYPDNGVAKSRQLRQDFLDSIPGFRKEAILNKAEQLFSHTESVWNSFGHKPQWTNQATIDTNRSINLPTDESLYARRDAHCEVL